jgi:hypothetical protein
MTFEHEEDEYLTRCVVNTMSRSFNLYSNFGEEKVIMCNNIQEFMNVLSFVRGVLEEDTLSYSDPLILG